MPEQSKAITNPQSLDTTVSRKSGKEAEVKDFKCWLKGSKAVDAHGKPLVLHHATKAKFEAFDEDFIEHFGFHVGSAKQAQEFGEHSIELHICVKNPIHLSDLGTWGFERVAKRLRSMCLIDGGTYDRAWATRDKAKELRTILLEKGYDGMVYESQAEGGGRSYILFKPEQLRLVP